MIRHFRKVAVLVACSIALSTVPIGSSAFAQAASKEVSRTLSFRQIIRRIFRSDEERDPPTISRGGVCLVTPTNIGESQAIWHDRPVFVWRGAIAQIKVIDAATAAILWEYSPALRETQATYAGDPLQANRRYRWQVFTASNPTTPQRSFEFEILPTVMRSLITNGLNAAEHSAANTADFSLKGVVQQAAARAQYFVNHDLEADAIQALFSVNTTANDEATSESVAELLSAQQEILDKACGQGYSSLDIPGRSFVE